MSRGRNKIYKVRAVERRLRDNGFELSRRSGGHHVYRHPSGVTVILPHEWNGEISDGMAHQIQKLIRRAREGRTDEIKGWRKS